MAKFKLLEIRRQKGISQNELSDLSGVSSGYISELENNLKSPTIDTVCKLAKALNCSIEDLIDCN